jgi:2-amino-4-hydroxy-6-hydroxymethyldihydropteridine diphosphokinase
MTKKTAIALGSNLGESLKTLETALEILHNTPKIQVIKKSSWYQTTPMGPPQPDYINGCAILSVEITPQELLTTLLEIEQKFGRIRQEKWGARTIDLDILLFDDLILNSSTLQIPHPRMTERAFVLIPLAEIAPELVHPITKKAIAQHLQDIQYTGVQLI